MHKHAFSPSLRRQERYPYQRLSCNPVPPVDRIDDIGAMVEDTMTEVATLRTALEDAMGVDLQLRPEDKEDEPS
jgi:hypothetical protein